MNSLFIPLLINRPFDISLISNDEPYAAPSHYHNAYELYYLVEGKRNYLTETNIYQLSPHWVTLTKPNVYHATSGQKYKRYVLYFSEDFLLKYFHPDFVKQLLQCFSRDSIAGQAVQTDPRIQKLLYLLLDDCDKRRYDIGAIRISELLLRLNAVQKIDTASTIVESPFIQQVFTYIEENLNTINSLEEVSNHFFLSKYHFSRVFKKETGHTFFEFLINARIAKALHFLKTSTFSINEISALCGFSTRAYFFVVFKKKMGMTPLAYRKEQKKQAK